MPVYEFEITEVGRVKTSRRFLMRPDRGAIWGRVEALALRVRGRNDAAIRVKNSSGAILARVGVATALASIEGCSVADCPLKRELVTAAPASYHVDIECPLIERRSNVP